MSVPCNSAHYVLSLSPSTRYGLITTCTASLTDSLVPSNPASA